MNNVAVLVLNQNYEPLNVCNLHRAMGMIIGGKAEILENGRGLIHSAHQAWPVPSVIRLGYMIKRPVPRVRLCRKELFRRDAHTCQYCGKRTPRLTVDHVLPRYLGGPHSWENLVSACPACNRRKGGKTLDQTRMRLLHQPREPRATGEYLFESYLEDNESWGKFVNGWWN
jgi:5-methylcytosine-specific restriction endonuclease McrA